MDYFNNGESELFALWALIADTIELCKSDILPLVVLLQPPFHTKLLFGFIEIYRLVFTR
ncbi:MAG: hypothetical protein ACJA0U_001789 [Salibacteraceae bacterium]|jgi:hypothetical protein